MEYSSTKTWCIGFANKHPCASRAGYGYIKPRGAHTWYIFDVSRGELYGSCSNKDNHNYIWGQGAVDMSSDRSRGPLVFAPYPRISTDRGKLRILATNLGYRCHWPTRFLLGEYCRQVTSGYGDSKMMGSLIWMCL